MHALPCKLGELQELRIDSLRLRQKLTDQISDFFRFSSAVRVNKRSASLTDSCGDECNALLESFWCARELKNPDRKYRTFLREDENYSRAASSSSFVFVGKPSAEGSGMQSNSISI